MLLKELQSLGLDVRVLKDDNTEVEIKETVDYGETDMRSVLEGDFKDYRKDENFAKSGYSTQEFDEDSGDLVDVEEESEDAYDADEDFDESYDDTDE